MIFDIITYNGEEELFEIRYNVLKDYVDEFRVVEFDKTFSGKPKESIFNQNWPKVKHYFITEDVWSKYREVAKQSPNTEYGKGAEHWVREFCQKESIKDCLTGLGNLDVMFIGDCDEIWNPEYVNSLKYKYYGFPKKLKLGVYSYWLNNKSSEQFWGTIVARYIGDVKDKDGRENCLNHLRVGAPRSSEEFGWHFTSIGSPGILRKKLTDSYTEESYATKSILDNLEQNINNNKDFLGRDFTYQVDESEWPQYLKNNREKYKYLLKT